MGRGCQKEKFWLFLYSTVTWNLSKCRSLLKWLKKNTTDSLENLLTVCTQLMLPKNFFFFLMLNHTSDFRDAKLPRCALFGISENIRCSEVRFPRKPHTFVISLAFGFCVFGLRMFSDLLLNVKDSRLPLWIWAIKGRVVFFDKYTCCYHMKHVTLSRLIKKSKTITCQQ